MTATSPSRRGSNSADPCRVERVRRTDRRRVLGLILTGYPDEQDPAIDQFLSFAATQNLDVSQLWAAERGGHPVAAVMVVPNVGRTAMLFMSPLRDGATRPALREASRRACEAQSPHKVQIVQALLEPSQHMEREVLAGAGFQDLAELLYLRCDVNKRGAPLRLDDSLAVRRWSDRDRRVFADTTLSSYEGTLDCPGLMGLRAINDILDGHMATGCFVPDLWLAVTCGDEPVGVMLLNPAPQRPVVELVYLGLSPAWRGRGLGRKLIQHGLWVAPQYKAREIILAVDKINTPARALYRSVGFKQTARKSAMIHPVFSTNYPESCPDTGG